MARTKYGLPGIYNLTPNTLENEEGTALATNVNGVLLVATGTGAADIGKAEDSAHTSGDVGVEMLSKRTDTAASSAGTDGDYATINTDSLGHVWGREGYVDQAVNNSEAFFAVQNKLTSTSTNSPTLFTNFGANTTLNIKATPGNVLSFVVTNTNAAVRYFQLHNTATTPAGAAVPLRTYTIPIGGQIVIGTDILTQAGVNLSTGIAYGISTTPGTFTNSATASEHYVEVNFK